MVVYFDDDVMVDVIFDVVVVGVDVIIGDACVIVV